MLCFQNSTYLDSPTLMTFSFSTDLNTSLPQVGQYGIRLGTLASSFDGPSKLYFHNLIGDPFVELQTLFMGATFYYMTCQLDKSTKNLNKCILVCPTKVLGPSFKQPKT
jgi:hypothetical protein